MIPDYFEIKNPLIAESDTGGIIEGCGGAVFEISDYASKNMAEGGIYLLDKKPYASLGHGRLYGEWRQTGMSILQGKKRILEGTAQEDAGGNVCIQVPEPLKSQIFSAIQDSGTYYAQLNSNSELVVIPNLGLAIFTHDR